jgi:AAT family amino acid transporter
MHGDALGWMDWMVLWTLWYVLFLGSYGIPAPRTDEPATVSTPSN